MNLFDCPECGWVTAHYNNCEIAKVDQLTQQDIKIITHALEVFQVCIVWDKANKINIQRVLSKAKRLQEFSPLSE